MILAIIGGSAVSIPVLALALRQLSTPTTIRLVGRHPRRLAAVARACRMLSEDQELTVEAVMQDEWPRALCGADVVMIQLRVGGLDGRSFDERFPLAYDVPGDEALGPGGFASALRAWPNVIGWLSRIEDAAPKAHVILLSSPAGLLIRIAARMTPNANPVHPCELPVTTLRLVSERIGVRVEELECEYAGVNHLGWFYNLRSMMHGRVACDSLAFDGFPDRRLLGELDAVPLRYLRLHYERERSLTEQRATMVTRAAWLAKYAQRAFSLFEAGDREAIRAVLRERPAPWYADAVIPVLKAWCGLWSGEPIFATAYRHGEPTREWRYHSTGNDLMRTESRSEPRGEISELLERLGRYEEIATDAILDPSIDSFTEALSTHPWVSSREQARGLARTIFANARTLQEASCR